MSNLPKEIRLAPLVESFASVVTRKYSPNFAFLDKSKPVGFWYKTIRLVGLLVNRDFDTAYETTVMGKCWVPPSFTLRTPQEQLEVVTHETVHEYDKSKLGGLVFGLMYLAPQVLTVFTLLSLLAIPFGLGWLACLGFLVFALPVPSPGRMWIELRGYRMSLLFGKEVYKLSDEDMAASVKWAADQFTSGSYYFMWPFRKHIERALVDPKFKKDEIAVEILGWLRNHGLAEKLPGPPHHTIVPT